MTSPNTETLQRLLKAINDHRLLIKSGAPYSQTEAAWNAISMRAGESESALKSLLNKPEAEAVAQEWYPEVCPITQRPFFMTIEHPEHGMVPTYGGPFDSYTIPERDDDGSWCCEHYDHDAGAWDEAWEDTGLVVVKDSAIPSYKLMRLVRKWRELANDLTFSGQTRRLCAAELEALLSQEPSSGEAQKPVAWIRKIMAYDKGSINAGENDEFNYPITETEAGCDKPDGDGWAPLFASPVTEGGDKD